MEHDESLLLDEERFVHILASSPSPTTTEEGIPRSRSLALRARRSNFILPSLSTSPSDTDTSSSSSSSSSPQPASSPVNNASEASPSCTVSSPIPIPSSSSSSSSSSKNKALTAKDLESKTQETGTAIDITDFECSLCFRVFFQPVTTVCGHVFCKQCLFSALKYSLQCPLCRHKLECSSSPPFKYSVNVVLMNMIEKYFPKELKERLDEEGQWQKPEVTPKEPEEETIVARPPSPSWSCILPSLRSTCTVILSCGGF